MFSSLKSVIKHAAIRFLLWREKSCGIEEANMDSQLPPELWGCSADTCSRLMIDGVSVEELTRKHGTPLYVVSQKELLRSYKNFLQAFDELGIEVVLATSYKTNPVPYVLETLHKAGSFADVISHFELWLALQIGIEPSRIILNGPGKGESALELAVTEGIGIINIDGVDEIERIAHYARSNKVKQRVGIRVVTSVGWSSQFGLSIASGEALAAFKKIRQYPELIPSGIHLHLGTGIQNVEIYVRAVREVAEFSDQLRNELDIVIDHYDLGGGFGVPTVRTMTDWDNRMVSLGYSARLADPEKMPTIKDYSSALKPLLRRMLKHRQNPEKPPTIVFEPGRAITSSCQTLLVSVIGEKSNQDGGKNLFVDGGKNITMPLGWETHQMFAVNRVGAKRNFRYNIFGPLCHPGDVLAKNRAFPKLGAGEVIAIMDAGAYFIPNQMNFSNPRPAIVRVADGTYSIVRERESFADVVRLDRMHRAL